MLLLIALDGANGHEADVDCGGEARLQGAHCAWHRTPHQMYVLMGIAESEFV